MNPIVGNFDFNISDETDIGFFGTIGLIVRGELKA
jgi:hypothetical protein